MIRQKTIQIMEMKNHHIIAFSYLVHRFEGTSSSCNQYASVYVVPNVSSLTFTVGNDTNHAYDYNVPS